jgi:iron complex outermembrane receptor protein
LHQPSERRLPPLLFNALVMNVIPGVLRHDCGRHTPSNKIVTRAILTGLLLALWVSAFPQGHNTINGKIFDPDGQPLEFANVILHQISDSSISKVEYTKENGSFQILNVPGGKYRIGVTYVGLDDFQGDIFELGAGEILNIPDIILISSVNDLDEILVSAKRPLLELSSDKLIFNVDGSINASGSNALELLRKSPGVLVDNNNNISILGKSGVRIFIDGRPSPLRGSDLSSYLESVQSTSIDAIEIISNPGARYEAEGDAGIINIRFKKDEGLGMNGTASAGYQYGYFSRYNGSLNGNYRLKRLNVFANVSVNDYKNKSYFNVFRDQGGFLVTQRNDAPSHRQSLGARFGMDFFLSEKSTLGLLIDGTRGDRDTDASSIATVGFSNSPDLSLLQSTTGTLSESDQISYNLNYLYKIGGSHELIVDLNYGQYESGRDQEQLNLYLDPETMAEESGTANETTAPRTIDIYAIKIDYQRPLGTANLQFGVKSSLVNTNNNFQHWDLLNNEKVLNIDRSNDFTFEENINALYIALAGNLGDNINYQLGLRAEQTNSTGHLISQKPTENDLVKRSYLDLFPSGSLNFTLPDDNLLQFSISRRLTRPSYQNLNPFRFQSDELTVSEGNPFLRPQYAYQYQVRYSFKSRLNATVAYSHTTDMMLRQTRAFDDRRAGLTWLNLAEQDNFSINIASPITITSWWDNFISVTAYYRQNTGDFGGGESVNAIARAVNLYGQETFKILPNLTLEVSGYYSTPTVWGGNLNLDALWNLDAGVQLKVMNGDGNLKVSMSDVFNTSPWQVESTFGILYLKSNGSFSDTRRLKFDFTYSFGNKKVKKARNRKMGLEDESSRIGT